MFGERIIIFNPFTSVQYTFGGRGNFQRG